MNWQELANLLHDFRWAVAGFFGALAASFFHRDELHGKRDFALFFGSGWACAYFMTGMVADYFAVNQEHMGAVGFMLGAFGGSLISAVNRSLRTIDLGEIIKQRLGGGN